MTERIIETLGETIAGRTTLGIVQTGGPCSYPIRPFFVELPSGMRHWFETIEDARSSQYWPNAMNSGMKLDDLDWSTITEAQARRLLGPARRREQAVGRKFEAGLVTEDVFIAAMLVEENLRVFSLTGLRPGQH